MKLSVGLLVVTMTLLVALMAGAGAQIWNLSQHGLLVTVAPPSLPGFYVATNGNDSNPGTLLSPFATLTKCQSAMRGSGTIKTCYIRAGTYTPAKVTSGTNCLYGATYRAGVTGGSVVQLTSSDNNEVWSYYPPDGVDTAIIDGQSTVGMSGRFNNGDAVGTANGIGCGFSNSGGSGITIVGIKFIRFAWSAYWGMPSTGLTFKWNEVTGITSASFAAGAVASDCGQNISVINNYIHDNAYMGAIVYSGTVNPTACFSNLLYQGNVLKNNCTYAPNSGAPDQDGGDCGALYVIDKNGAGSSTGIRIINNWMQDQNTVSNGAGSFGTGTSVGIYLDEIAANATVTGNVVLGIKSAPIHLGGGSNNLVQNNLFDLDNPSALGSNLQNSQSQNFDNISTTNERIQNNIFVSGASQAGRGFEGDSGAHPATISHNWYHNYVGSSISTASAGGGADSSPVQPGSITGTPINCWAPTITAGTNSPASAPVSFPVGLVGGGGWGPPGFVIPQTGTPPSWPHGC